MQQLRTHHSVTPHYDSMTLHLFKYLGGEKLEVGTHIVNLGEGDKRVLANLTT